MDDFDSYFSSAAVDWNESDHPREDDGEFAPAGGGAPSGGFTGRKPDNDLDRDTAVININTPQRWKKLDAEISRNVAANKAAEAQKYKQAAAEGKAAHEKANALYAEHRDAVLERFSKRFGKKKSEIESLIKTMPPKQRLQFMEKYMEESKPTMAVANDSAISYFGLALSENICRTPEGYVICKDAVIGRTGKQQYLVSSLHSGQLSDLGLTGKYRPNEVVDVWRDPEEVFSPAALSSYEGKPITDNHPNEFVTAENWSEHSRGHVQNVRAGTTPLSTGDMPVLGDVIITDPDLGNDVLQRRRRELSGGYNYHLAYDGIRLSQVGITGNHVAVVPKGRAGAEARINDAAAPRKEYPVMFKDLLIGLGLKQMATDNADPEKIVAAARGAFATDAAEPTKDPALEAKDAEIAELKTKLQTATDALKAKDAEPEEKKEEKAEDSLEAKLAALDEDDDEEEEGEKKKEKAEDADFIQPIGAESAVAVDLRASLRELRPLVARSKDAALIAKFNKLSAKANDRIVTEKPNAYAIVKGAAGTKSQQATDAQADYSARLNARAEARSRGEEVK